MIEIKEKYLEKSDYKEYFSIRIAKLRTLKDVSARDMSLSIGLSKSYITGIERKKMLPSMIVFLQICDYLDITPKEFFDDEMENPESLVKLFEDLKSLTQEELESVINIVAVILKKKNK